MAEELLSEYRNLWPIPDGYIIGNKDYDRIADYIKDKLQKKFKKYELKEKIRIGVTVSASTIERILNKEYQVTFLKNGAINAECEKVLNKISIFLDYRNWYDFLIVTKGRKNGGEMWTDIRNVVRDAFKAKYTFLGHSCDEFIQNETLRNYYEYDSEAWKYLLQEMDSITAAGIELKFYNPKCILEPLVITNSVSIIKSLESCFAMIEEKKTGKPARTVTKFGFLVYTLHYNYIIERWLITNVFLQHEHYTSIYLPEFHTKEYESLLVHDRQQFV